MKSGVVLGAVIAAVAASAAFGDNKTFQCWTDDKGQRMCGDTVPSEYAGKKREVINQRGQVIETKRGALSPAEQVEAARKAKEEEAARKQAEYDQQLLQTYRSAKDIENMRNERIALIDARITASQKIKEENETSLKNLHDRADALTKDNKPVDDRLAKQIKQYEKLVKDNGVSLERMAKERQQTDQTFTRDAVRYNELRGLPPPATAAPATPATVTPAATKPGAAPVQPATATGSAPPKK